MALARYIEFLSKNKLLTFNVLSDTNEGFESRLKIQKMVYLASFFGLDLGYKYRLYKHGPYSTRLAMDYYELAEVPQKYMGEFEGVLPNTFDSDGFINCVGRKNKNWLEISTTLIEERTKFPNKSQLVTHVHKIKPRYTIEYIEQVYDEMVVSELKRIFQN